MKIEKDLTVKRRIWKKILWYMAGILCGCLGLCINTEASGTTVFQVENQSGKRGDTITVPVTIDTGEEVGGFDITVYYDGEMLEFQNLEQGELVEESGLFDSNHKEESHSIKIIYVTPDTVKANGVVANLTFSLKKDCEEQLPIAISDREVIDASEESSYIPSSVEGVDPQLQAQVDAASENAGHEVQNGVSGAGVDTEKNDGQANNGGTQDEGIQEESKSKSKAANNGDANDPIEERQDTRQGSMAAVVLVVIGIASGCALGAVFYLKGKSKKRWGQRMEKLERKGIRKKSRRTVRTGISVLACILILLLCGGLVNAEDAETVKAAKTVEAAETMKAVETAEATETDAAQEFVQEGELRPAGQNTEWGIRGYALENEFQDSYGEQLEADAAYYYLEMLDKYLNRMETDAIIIYPENPIQFIAQIENDAIVKDENYQQASDMLIAQLQSAGDAFQYDWPEVYWIRYFSYRYFYSVSQQEDGSYLATITRIELIPKEYYQGASEEQEIFWNAIGNAVEEIETSYAVGNKYETVTAVHDYLCRELEYNWDAANIGGEEYLYAHAASTSFIGNKQVVCEGYAKAFKILCDQFEIPCVLVSGIGASGSTSGGHMWNDVKLNGKWYGVDVTWDDNEKPSYEYFLTGSETVSRYWGITFRESHQENGDFNGSGLWSFTYPMLEQERYVYQPDAFRRGDVNEDDTVDIQDLRIMLRAVCGKIELTERQVEIGDVVEDGIVDIQDLRKVLRYVCGKIVDL